MAKVNVSVVHKLNGEIVAVGPATASLDDGTELTGVAIAGPDEAVTTAKVDEDELASMHRTHVVAEGGLKRREES